MKEVVEKNKTLSQVSDSEIPAELQPQIKQIRQSNPNAKFTYIEGETKEISALAETYKNFKPLAILANPKKGTTGILLQDMSSYAENIKSADDVYMVVEQAASPVGGFSSFMQYLRTNLNYPEAARNANIQGKVFIQFVVQADGSITDTEILKGIGGGCDEEALRVVAASPKWNPGKQKGVAIKQRMSVPIAFNLGNEQGSAKTTNTP
jgi:TonB family protein